MSDRQTTLGRDIDQSIGGYEMVFAGVLFALFGLWLDRRLDLTPVLTIVFAVVGFAGGVAAVYYRYQRDIARIEAQIEDEREAERAATRRAVEQRRAVAGPATGPGADGAPIADRAPIAGGDDR